MGTNRPTIVDVARMAGTSKSVVSRVVTGKGAVSEPTRQRVLQAMKTLDYRQNVAASSLKSGRTGTVGVLLRNVEAPFYSTLFAQLQRQAAQDDIRVVAATGNMVPGSEETALETLLTLGVDALVIGSGTLPNPMIDRVARRVPTVVCGRPAPDTAASAVLDDPQQQAELTIDALAGAGHDRVALLETAPHIFSGRPRVEAFLRLAGARGLRVRVEASGYEARLGHEATARIVAAETGETAIVAPGHAAGVGALMACREQGLEVPQDLSVVTLDGFHHQDMLQPHISGTVRDPGTFAQIVWAEVQRRSSAAEPRTLLVPVQWRDAGTLSAAAGQPTAESPSAS